MLRFRSPTLSAIAAFAVGVSFIHAADEVPTIEQRLQALDQEIKILKRKAELEAEAAVAKAAAAKDAPKFTASAKDGFSLGSADGSWKLKFGGSAQLEGRYYLNDEDVPQTNTFFVRRVRPYLQGTVGKYFDYQLVLDASAATVALLDAHVTANILPEFKIQAGRFKTPLGLEFLQSDPVTPFIERAFPSQIAPGRDAGAQVLGELFGGLLAYQVGVFNGPTDGQNRDPDTGDDKDAIGRIFAAPFKNSDISALSGLSLGIGGSFGVDKGTISATGQVTATSLPSYVSPGANTFFSYKTNTNVVGNVVPVANGERVRFSPQLYYTFGPFDLMAEYIESKQEVDVRQVTVAPTVTAGGVTAVIDSGRDVKATAWQLEAGFVLTGEDASFRGVSPKGGGIGTDGWGAVQLVVRVSQLSIDDDVFSDTAAQALASRHQAAKSALDFGIGVNWWLNRNLRIALDYDRTEFDGGAGTSNLVYEDKETEHVIRSRLQLTF